jgi:nucleotide-binding universal stress UspA family protein
MESFDRYGRSSKPKRWIMQEVAGHPVRDIVKLAADLNADLLVIGATGHSAIYERIAGSRADRIMQLAKCPVLIVK